MLGQKRSASVFQNVNTPAEDIGNHSEPSEQLYQNLQFGPNVDILSPPHEPKPVASVAEPIATEPEPTTIRDNRPLRSHALFFAPETEGKDFSSVLSEVQEYISANYSGLITGTSEDAKAQMKRYITKYIQDKRIAVGGMAGEKLVDALYTEMAEFGFLTKYIFGTGIEEIDSATRS